MIRDNFENESDMANLLECLNEGAAIVEESCIVDQIFTPDRLLVNSKLRQMILDNASVEFEQAFDSKLFV